MYSIKAKHSREPELKGLINYVDKETALVSDPLFSKEAVEQYLDKRDVKVDKRRRVEAIQSDLRKYQRRNQIRTKKGSQMCHVWCWSCIYVPHS